MTGWPPPARTCPRKLEAWAGRWIGDEPYAAVTADQAELLLGGAGWDR